MPMHSSALSNTVAELDKDRGTRGNHAFYHVDSAP